LHIVRKVASVAAVEEDRTDSRGWLVASEMAVIARGHAALACSFIVPQKPQASFWVAGICWLVFISGSLGLIVATPVVTRCSIEKPSPAWPLSRSF